MNELVDQTDDYISDQFQLFTKDLSDLLAQPSISATGEGVGECTELVKQYCQTYGFDKTNVISTDGHPVVVAYARADSTKFDKTDTTSSGKLTDQSGRSVVHPGDNGEGSPDVPTVLLYGHYDVQPVDTAEWETPPFEPTIRTGPDGRDRIYARGAGDNKGQWFAHLCAIKTLRQTGGLPANVVLVLEGEEESGSPHLGSVVHDHADELAANLAFVADGPIDNSSRPHVLLGARGLLYVQLDAFGPDKDLHSGNYGGPIPNPAWELVRLLGTMKNAEGRVTIDGFYDEVRPISPLDIDILESIPFDEESMLASLGMAEFADGPGDSALENLYYYPTLNISGFTSGYSGEGVKTVLPSTAQVKVDIRLVSDQRPEAVFERFVQHVEKHRSDTVTIEVSHLGAMAPQRTPLDHPYCDPIVDAVRDAWNDDPILKPNLGGSLPTAVFADGLDVPCFVVPYANSDENNHSPDENLSLWCFHNGIKTTVRMLTSIGSM